MKQSSASKRQSESSFKLGPKTLSFAILLSTLASSASALSLNTALDDPSVLPDKPIIDEPDTSYPSDGDLPQPISLSCVCSCTSAHLRNWSTCESDHDKFVEQCLELRDFERLECLGYVETARNNCRQAANRAEDLCLSKCDRFLIPQAPSNVEAE